MTVEKEPVEKELTNIYFLKVVPFIKTKFYLSGFLRLPMNHHQKIIYIDTELTYVGTS